MRQTLPPELEAARKAGEPGQTYGAFSIRSPWGEKLNILASDGKDWRYCGFSPPAWEHVSVSHPRRCPTWDEMCWVKSLFWEPEECTVQYHPPESKYVRDHDFVLHIWKVIGAEFPMPPIKCV